MKTTTSVTQFQIMVEYMEKHGDLSKPSSAANGRHWIGQRWTELTSLLNSVGVGTEKSEEKWRKVWSDLKTNTKRKAAKLNRSFGGTGGGPPLISGLTDLEVKVLAIINIQAATGINGVDEVGLSHINNDTNASTNAHEISEVEIREDTDIDTINKIIDDCWDTAGPSTRDTTQPACIMPDLHPEGTASNIPSWHPRKRKRTSAELFIESETNAREYEKERDRVLFGFERERIRQRDTELQLQSQWIELAKEMVSVVKQIGMNVKCECSCKCGCKRRRMSDEDE